MTDATNPQPADDPAEDDAPKDVFSGLAEWVEIWFYKSVLNELHYNINIERTMCPQWWRHRNVSLRLHSLWRAWEAAARADDDVAMSNWWIHHADPHLAKLLHARTGPMRRCSVTGHNPDRETQLTLEPCPTGWFDIPDVTDLTLTTTSSN